MGGMSGCDTPIGVSQPAAGTLENYYIWPVTMENYELAMENY